MRRFKNELARPHFLLWVLACGCWVACAMAGEPLEVRSIATSLRQTAPEAFTLEVELHRPVNALLPGQGNTTLTLRITVDNDVTANVWKAIQLPAGKYYPPKTDGYQPVDYDEKGNLILSMWSNGTTIRDRQSFDEYLESVGFRVAPDGTTVPFGEAAAHLNRFPPAHDNSSSMTTLRGIQCALGLLSVDDLRQTEVDDLNSDGTHNLRVTGQFSRHSGVGEWNLVVDSANGNLVRKAEFGQSGQAPRITCSCEGTRWFGDTALADRGEYTIGPLRVSVRLISYKPEFDANIVAEARAIIGRAQTRNVQLFDYRDDVAKPKVEFVRAGDLARYESARSTSKDLDKESKNATPDDK